jgi:hypothetical protein
VKKKLQSRGLEIVPSRKAGKSTKTSPSKPPAALKASSIPKGRAFHTPVAILRRLDIDPKEVAEAPKVTDILVRCLGGSEKKIPRKQILNYLSASPAPEAAKFLRSCREIPKADLERLTLEAICVHAHVSPLAVFGAVVKAAGSLKSQESALKAILAHPDVVDATVETAKFLGPLGHADRKILHEAIGFLPTRKGGGVEINFFGKPKENEDEPDDDDKAWDEAFPAISANLEGWAENRRSLTDGK